MATGIRWLGLSGGQARLPAPSVGDDLAVDHYPSVGHRIAPTLESAVRPQYVLDRLSYRLPGTADRPTCAGLRRRIPIASHKVRSSSRQRGRGLRCPGLARGETWWRGSIIRRTFDGPGVLRAGSADMSLISFMGRDVDVRWEIVEFEHETRLCGEYALGVRGGRDRYMLNPSASVPP